MTMIRPLFSLFSFLVAVATCAAVSGQPLLWEGYRRPGFAAETEVDSGKAFGADELRFFLLKTGFLLEGTSTSDGHHYAVKTEFGGMKIPVSNVEYIGETREDVFRFKNERTGQGNYAELMKLAEWCLSNDLTDCGIDVYEKAHGLAPNPVMADFIRQRIRAASRPPAEPTAESGLRPTLPGKEPPDPWMDGIPKPVLDLFAKKVQPVLVSRCASADCHGSRSDNQFKISVPHQTRGTTTYRNLKAAVQWIDLDHPTDSPLLSALVVAHGGAKAPFNVESSQYDHFVQWIRLTGKELPPQAVERLTTDNRGRNTPWSVATRDAARNERPAPGETAKTGTLPPAIRDAMEAGRLGPPGNRDAPDTFLSSRAAAPPTGRPSARRPLRASPGNGVEPANYIPTRLIVPDCCPEADPPPPGNFEPIRQPVPQAPARDPLAPDLFNAKYHTTQ